MDREALKKLIEQARRDPEFLHSLVFEPQKAVDKADFLDRSSRSRLLRTRPDQVFARFAADDPADNAP